jgi:hypothetical protein
MCAYYHVWGIRRHVWGILFDPDIEETADPVGVAWRFQDDRGLVVGRASDIDDDPAVG